MEDGLLKTGPTRKRMKKEILWNKTKFQYPSSILHWNLVEERIMTTIHQW
jgi:hypothetical protein